MVGYGEFRPEQFELQFYSVMRPEHEGWRLDPLVASQLANDVFAANNAEKVVNAPWPPSTHIFVLIGSVSAYGPSRIHGTSLLREHDHAVFGMDIESPEAKAQSTLYASYMAGVQRALDRDEVQAYQAEGPLAIVSHLGRLAALNRGRERYHRKVEQKVGELLAAQPEPLEPLFFKVEALAT